MLRFLQTSARKLGGTTRGDNLARRPPIKIQRILAVTYRILRYELVRIAYVYDVVYPYVVGGVQKRVWEIARRLTLRGHEVHVFGMKNWDGCSLLVKEGVRLHGVCPPRILYDEDRRSIDEAIFFARKVMCPLLHERFDVIDCQNFPYFPSFSSKLASLLRKSGLVLTWHEVWNDYWYEYLGKKGLVGKCIERIVAHLTNNIIAVSEMTSNDLNEIGVPRNLVRVIPNGIDFKAIEAVMPANEQSDIIFVGRLIKEKNADLLMRAISLVKTSMPDIRCIVIGDGPERKTLENLMKALDISENVRMKGFLGDEDEVLSYMKSAKVFVLPSVREGFGIVALEANACGLPIITVKHSSNAICDFVEHGQNGLVCQIFEGDLADSILAVLTSKNTQSRECVRRAQEYDWNNVAVMTESFYYETLAK
jgi:glycosyltransferase involved in cell wall biosynthesis